MRHVIIHYHIFKNAGSSIDSMLSHNHGPRWAQLEGKRPWSTLLPEAVGAFIAANPEVLSLSSHHARLPVPCVPGVTFHPIVILRHPIDRAYSVYSFERGQPEQGAGPGVLAAKRYDFADYVRWRLEPGNGCVISDFQTIFLAGSHVDMSVARALSSDFHAASARLMGLPFFGLVERFKESVHLLERSLSRTALLEHYNVGHINRNPDRADSLELRIEQIRKSLGGELFETLVARNQHDLRLFALASELFDRRLVSIIPQ
ncbi:hypothetical protein [Fundidesulfovibrio soli]|uniref:hypothetical protein n=1 Tax=Fundidesulfovibrio soli TaxID=2922716 RepID=UPI001FAEC83D|nr:hypothetical protein [Fundidesulfovibrio soli]